MPVAEVKRLMPTDTECMVMEVIIFKSYSIERLMMNPSDEWNLKRFDFIKLP